MLELRFSWLQQPLLVQHRNTAGVAFKSVWWTVKTKASAFSVLGKSDIQSCWRVQINATVWKTHRQYGRVNTCVPEPGFPTSTCSLVGCACSLQESTHSRSSGFYPLRCQHKIILKILPGTVTHPLGGNSQSRTTDLIYIHTSNIIQSEQASLHT